MDCHLQGSTVNSASNASRVTVTTAASSVTEKLTVIRAVEVILLWLVVNHHCIQISLRLLKMTLIILNL
jgi:hypothetical protein